MYQTHHSMWWVKAKHQLRMRCQSGPSAKSSVISSEGDSSKTCGADQQRLQISDLRFDKFPTPATFACWKKRFKTELCILLTISYGSYALDQRSGDGWFSGWIKIFVIFKRTSNAAFWSTWWEDCFSTEQNHPQFSFQRKNLSGGTKGPEWSTNTSGSQEPMILSKTIPTCSLSFYEMTIFRTSTQSGTEFYYQWRKSRLMISGKDCTNKEYESLRNSWPYWKIGRLGDSSKEVRTWSQIENWWKEVLSKKFEIRIFGAEVEILRRMPWSRISEQNSVYKEFLEIVGNGKPTGSVWKETIAVSATIWISVRKVHHQIRLRILSCGRVSEKSSRTRSPRGKSPSGRMSRWLCTDYLRRTCNNSFCKKWHPPECLFYKTKSGCRFGENAHMHIARLMNNLSKNVQKEWWQKCSSHVEEKWSARKHMATCCQPWQKSRQAGATRCLTWSHFMRWVKDLLGVDHRIHDNWVVSFKIWSRRSLSYGRAQTCRHQSNVWDSQRLLHVTLKFETKILRSDIFAQVNPISVAPKLQNLRIGLRRRQSGKGKVPARQRGRGPKVLN